MSSGIEKNMSAPATLARASVARIANDVRMLLRWHFLNCSAMEEALCSFFMSEVTRILSAIEQGDPHAAERLLPLVYDELRRLATEKMTNERPGQTLQATALVNEAYLRLVDTEKIQRWNSRGHFFAAAAEAMRRILIENARRKSRSKHGGDRERVNLDDVEIAVPEMSEELLTLDDALTELAVADPQAARLVNLRYFAGLTIKEAADLMEISPRAADFLWAYARAWLLKKINVGAISQPTSKNSAEQ